MKHCTQPATPSGQPLLVTAAVICDGGRILITRRPETSRHGGMWEFPGGKLDPGESPQAALQRELDEELGVTAEVGEVFATAYHRYSWGPVLILAYMCRICAGPIHNIGVAEHRWVSPHELSDYALLPADRPVVERILRLHGVADGYAD